MKNLNVSKQHFFEAHPAMITTTPHRDLDEGFAADEFKRIVLETVDETFSSLGKRAKQSIYFQLEKTYGMTRENIPNEIEKFATLLEKIFGPGAKLLEIEIMKQLREKIGPKFKYHPKRKNLIFTEYLETARALLFECAPAKKPMPNEYYDYKFC